MTRKPRIPTDGAPPLSANPFAALQGALGELPAGDPTPAELAPDRPPDPPSTRSLLHGKLVLRRETKGRGGKTVTLVRGLALDEAGLAALGKKLRSACGAGGAAKDGVLEIQGDHVERVLELLAREGLAARRAGG